MFIAITMTGLDQEMMQKNISVRTLKDSQKNILTFSFTLLIVNFLFLFMGGLLYLFALKNNITVASDDLFPTIALKYMPPITAITVSYTHLDVYKRQGLQVMHPVSIPCSLQSFNPYTT